MGMFDYVLPDANVVIKKCPRCKHKFNLLEQEWQTKSNERLLLKYSLRTLRHECGNFEIHTICDHCNTYIKAEFSDNEVTLEYVLWKFHNRKVIRKRLSNKQFEIYRALSEDDEGIDYNFGGFEDEDT